MQSAYTAVLLNSENKRWSLLYAVFLQSVCDGWEKPDQWRVPPYQLCADVHVSQGTAEDTGEQGPRSV